jgi:hypothetical protein
MAQRLEILQSVRSTRSPRHDVIHISCRFAAVPAKWLSTQHEQPEPLPGGPIASLAGVRSPLVLVQVRPHECTWRPVGFQFARHGYILPFSLHVRSRSWKRSCRAAYLLVSARIFARLPGTASDLRRDGPEEPYTSGRRIWHIFAQSATVRLSQQSAISSSLRLKMALCFFVQRFGAFLLIPHPPRE